MSVHTVTVYVMLQSYKIVCTAPALSLILILQSPQKTHNLAKIPNMLQLVIK